ncbi:LysM peptidoglycan-binding domain-containing protein [Cohnella candidum]|nr:LysM peptidoglycan-binding domain-containing protein [Cohnella candidum]
MVQSWALGSHTSSVTAVRRSSSSNRGQASSRQGSGQRWRLARMMFFVLAFAILFSGFALVKTFASEENVQPASTAEKVVYADSGDTLWHLAATLKKDSMDTRKAVRLLMERNDLHDPSLKNGQMLIVPNEMLP